MNLRIAGAKEIIEMVAPEIRVKHKSFNYCPNCNKICWTGSHTRRMQAAIQEIFETQLNS